MTSVYKLYLNVHVNKLKVSYLCKVTNSKSWTKFTTEIGQPGGDENCLVNRSNKWLKLMYLFILCD